MSDNQLWRKLKQDLQRQVDTFPGVAGVCIHDLHAQRTMALNGDELFPTASTIKIHVLVQLLRRAASNEIDLSDQVHVSSDLLVGGSGILCHLESAQRDQLYLSLLDLAALMIMVSDNTATNICIDYAGGLDAVNALLRELDLPQTKLRRKMMDTTAARANAENISSPQELVRMLSLLEAGMPSSEVATQTLSILKKPKRDVLGRVLPPTVPLANKPGAVERTRCDAGLIYLQRRPYAIAIMSKFALCPASEQEQYLFNMAQTVYKTMQALAVSNRFGHGVYTAEDAAAEPA